MLPVQYNVIFVTFVTNHGVKAASNDLVSR